MQPALRREIEGRVYPTLQAKQDALEKALKAWQADPEGPQGPARRSRSNPSMMDWYKPQKKHRAKGHTLKANAIWRNHLGNPKWNRRQGRYHRRVRDHLC